MWPNPQESADLVTFTQEILNEKLHFLCSVHSADSKDTYFTNISNKNGKTLCPNIRNPLKHLQFLQK